MAGDAEEEPELAAEAPPDWVPEGIDLATPSVARAYDYALGGSHSFAVDRALLRSVEAVFPQIRAACRANRAFLHRAVRFMIEGGGRPFLHLRSGIPTVRHGHAI